MSSRGIQRFRHQTRGTVEQAIFDTDSGLIPPALTVARVPAGSAVAALAVVEEGRNRRLTTITKTSPTGPRPAALAIRSMLLDGDESGEGWAYEDPLLDPQQQATFAIFAAGGKEVGRTELVDAEEAFILGRSSRAPVSWSIEEEIVKGIVDAVIATPQQDGLWVPDNLLVIRVAARRGLPVDPLVGGIAMLGA